MKSSSITLSKIKVALAHPAASNGVCPRQRSGCNGLLKIDYFHLVICFCFFLVSLIFNIVFDYIGSCSISYGSNISSITPQFPTPKLFFNFSRPSADVLKKITFFLLSFLGICSIICNTISTEASGNRG